MIPLIPNPPNSLAALFFCLMAGLTACVERQAAQEDQSSLTGLLSEDANEGYLRAMEPLPLVFPRDHGAHPGYRIEWWYFTGNLVTDAGREFGYQFTLFRNAIAPRLPDSASNWATSQIYMAHAALSDIRGKRFYHYERFSRAALGLAGVESDPFRAYLEDWTVAGEPCSGEGCFAVSLTIDTPEFNLRLSLQNDQPVVLHGDQGLSAKSRTPGNASYYYSYPRLRTEGQVRLGGQSYRVAGDSWFDHEWSSSMLEKNQTGWDWFSLQLSGDLELMIFRVRDRDPDRHFFAGTLVHANNRVEILGGEDFSLRATDTWQSNETGSVYPAAWELTLPAENLDLKIVPKLPDQELHDSFHYWEGAVRIFGTKSGQPVSGQGYVELTGY